MGGLSSIFKAVTNPGDLNKGWDSFKAVDPLASSIVPGVASLEDKTLAKGWDSIGVGDAADFHEKDSDNAGRALRHRGLAALAFLAGSAAAGGGAGGGASGGATGGGSGLGGPLSFQGAATGAPSLGGGISTSLDAGVTSAGSGGVGSAGGVSGSSGAGLAQWQNAMKLLKQGSAQEEGPQYRAEMYQLDPYLQSLMTSSKRAKTTAKDGKHAAVQRGLSGANPIDANGVQVLQLQKLTKQLVQLDRLVTQLERQRARKV